MHTVQSVLQSLITFLVDTQKVPTAMIQREIADWLGGESFRQFAKSFPKPAELLKKTVTDNKVLSGAALIAIGSLISSTLMKKTPAIAHSALADFLMSLRRSAGTADVKPVSQAEYAKIGTTIFQMDADSMQKFIEWQRDFTNDQRSLVYTVLIGKSADEIQELMRLEEQQRWDVLNFMHSCETYMPPTEDGDAIDEEQSSEESLLLSGLRSLRTKLEQVQSNQQTGSTEEGDDNESPE